MNWMFNIVTIEDADKNIDELNKKINDLEKKKKNILLDLNKASFEESKIALQKGLDSIQISLEVRTDMLNGWENVKGRISNGKKMNFIDAREIISLHTSSYSQFK